MENNRKRHFPLFINPKGLEVLVIGAGKIGTRRIKTLVKYDFNITVVSGHLSDELDECCAQGQLSWVQGHFKEEILDLKEWFFVVACTDDKEVNDAIYRLCKDRDILVNCCDNVNHCDFYFPAVFINDPISGGLVGDGSDHHLVSRAAKEVRKVIESIVDERK